MFPSPWVQVRAIPLPFPVLGDTAHGIPRQGPEVFGV